MKEMIFQILDFLTDVPVNFWFWLFFITAPLLVFSVGPENRFWLRLARLVLAAVLSYVLINLSLHTSRELGRKAYNECQRKSIHPEMSQEAHEQCKHHVNTADGAANVFYFILGWIPGTAYVGIWEFLWRRRYRKILKEMGKNYKGRWFSNITIGFTVFCFIYLFLHIFF